MTKQELLDRKLSLNNATDHFWKFTQVAVLPEDEYLLIDTVQALLHYLIRTNAKLLMEMDSD